MFSSHASPYAAKTLKILTHRVSPHYSTAACHHVITPSRGETTISSVETGQEGAGLRSSSGNILLLKCPGVATAK